ncbi:VWA containing CoxE family protein [Ectothiorhodospira shaposhnikovii]|uniref:VWA domain-containing protein n=1 Tax=Ectothiorhodospira shaposhnikovii TaxID=1054 RepID=UPI001902F23D|nr:VWA domain-containing protein [Ectothiorhodospira shaposhnikovii]MBK1674059.1 VWA containing CoxE family protein [Ectothiorhodospira shaposhnikovii]
MSDWNPDPATRRRWRLILGADADDALAGSGGLSSADQRRDRALDYLYRREHLSRESSGGIGGDLDMGDLLGGDIPSLRQGGVGMPTPEAVRWLGEVRELFPGRAAEVLQRDALSRYGLHDLFSDPQVLADLPPSLELVTALMAIRASLPPMVHAEARRLVARVVAQLEARLAPRVRAAFAPRRGRRGGRGRPRLADLDWHRTLRHNLRHYQLAEQTLMLERLFFHERQARRLPWELWLVIDQSGSMYESVIHSAVMGSIFARVKALRTRLLLFSDGIVDVTEQLHAPEDLLMGAQLGGGTNIGAALGHVGGQLTSPRRAVVILISDLYEGHDEGRVLQETTRLAGSGARLLALAALDRRANPDYDRDLAVRMVARGAEVAAMTPDALVDWLAGVLWRVGR